MDFHQFKGFFENSVLYGSLGLLCLMGFGFAAYAAYRLWSHFSVIVRKLGRGKSLVCGIFLGLLVTYAGTKPPARLTGGDPLFSPDEETPQPSIRQLTASDYEAGFALSRIGRNETHSFDMPTNAVPREDWRAYGSATVWFRLPFADGWTYPIGTNVIDALTVFPHGAFRPRTKNAATQLSPLNAPMGFVRAELWEQLNAADRPSQFWHQFTPSNSLVMTWQNALLGEDADRPIGFQAELFANGDLVYRYDLSRLPEAALSNLTVGVRNENTGRAFSVLPKETTSLYWARLDPTRASNPDPDDDGLSTSDELFLCQTDPYAADTDFDGLSDLEEVSETGTDPTNAHSLNPLYCDSMALVIGDLDPFARPAGSTNTVFEHVFYTGTTNAPFIYPQSSGTHAVLKVSVSGTGSGELILGDRVVPLLAPPSRARSSNSETSATNSLLVSVGKGKKMVLWFRKPEGLDVALDSDDLLIGDLPGLSPRGWIAFPHTDATIPCIHDLNIDEKTLTLVYGEEFPGLTAVWHSDAQGVTITNLPPVSAKIHGSFKKTETRTIRYAVSHPQILNANRTAFEFEQTFRYCPRLTEEEDWMSGLEAEEVPEEGPSDDRLPESDGSEAQAYTNALTSAGIGEAGNILHLYGENRHSVDLTVPEGEPRRCCECPEHWASNYVAVAGRSIRLNVLAADGEPFSLSTESCTVNVVGAKPSLAINDASVCFVTNGLVDRTLAFTVLGVGIESSPSGVPMSRYNELSPTLGYPVVVNTNLLWAAEWTLLSDVHLTNGIVRLALEAPLGGSTEQGEFEIWLSEWLDRNCYLRPPELLLKTNVRETRTFTHQTWRKILRRYGSNNRLRLLILSSKQGAADFLFDYVNVEDGVRVRDFVRQRLTAIPPPLLPGYNHDGAINVFDGEEYVWARPYQFWTNEETIKGDCVGQISDSSRNADDETVNGTYDLLNFFAVRVDTSVLRTHWNLDSLRTTLGPSYYRDVELNLTFVDVASEAVCSIQTNAVHTLSGEGLSSAPLRALQDGIALTQSELAATNLMLVAEAPRVVSGALAFKVFDGEKELFSAPLRLSLSSVKDMYRWFNSRPYSSDFSGRVTCTNRPSNFPIDHAGKTKFFFLHGANVSSVDAEKWGDQIFKRLWHAGCHVDFYNVDWRSDIGSSANYHENASNAFVVASRLADDLKAMPGEKVIMAHSLGNMVASSMIQDHGLEVSRYIMCNSAVPAEAYDTALAPTNVLVHPDWDDYPVHARANEWHTLFDADDDRSRLTWKGRFADVASVAVNFYSTGDHVLELAPKNNLWATDGFENFSQMFERFSWHKQELWKGRRSTIAFLGTTDWSGWSIRKNMLGFNAISPSEAHNMPTNAFMTNTVFKLQPASMNTNAIPPLVRAAHLTQGIPARTPASGATKWGNLDRRMINLQSTNEVSGGISRPNGWIVRPNGWFDDWGDRWMHSDIKDMSYFYVYRFFEKVKELGGLQ